MNNKGAECGVRSAEFSDSTLRTLHSALELAQPLREVHLAGAAERGVASVPIPNSALRTPHSQMVEQSLREQRELVQCQKALLESLQNAMPEVVRDCEQALTSLCLEVAQKLVAGLPISAQMVEAVLQEALTQVEGTSHIYLNPADLQLLEEAKPALLSQDSNSRSLHFHAAPEMTRGGCLVKTQFGVIDAQRETKIELLKKSLLP